MMLYWYMWFLCLSAHAEIVAVYRQPKHITLECSTLACPSRIDGSAGMYLYKDDKEVLYYNNGTKSEDVVTPQQEKYAGRLQKKGYLRDNIITISNVTVADSGVYSCVYVIFPDHHSTCNVHKIEISEGAPQPSPELPETSAQESTSCPSLISIIIIPLAVAVLFTLSIVLMLLMVKRRAARRELRRTTDSGVSNEYVYEVMSKNGFHPVSP